MLEVFMQRYVQAVYRRVSRYTARRAGSKMAKVALARKPSVVLHHRMASGEAFPSAGPPAGTRVAAWQKRE